jgi:hypothetical protein
MVCSSLFRFGFNSSPKMRTPFLVLSGLVIGLANTLPLLQLPFLIIQQFSFMVLNRGISLLQWGLLLVLSLMQSEQAASQFTCQGESYGAAIASCPDGGAQKMSMVKCFFSVD